MMVGDRPTRSFQPARLVVVATSGAALWFAAFAKAQDFEGQLYPPMNAPLEALFSLGRTLSFGTMLLAVVVTLTFGSGLNRMDWRNASMYIAAVNVFILFKLMLYGNYEIFFQGSFAIIIQMLVFVVCASGYEKEEFDQQNHVSHVVQILYVFSVLFIFTNVYAFVYFPSSSTVQASGRFFGITANPQHLAMSCALCAPALLYCLVHYGVRSIIGASAGIMSSCVLFIEYESGSRLGFIATSICIIMACRYFLDRRRIVYVMIVGALALPVAYASFYESISGLLRSRFLEGRTDTRSEYWISGWNDFLQNPLVGIEPTGDPPKYYFTVSSWVSAAYSGGVIALVLLLVFLFSAISYVFRINKLRTLPYIDQEYVDLHISAVTMILVLSVFEAVFLGVFSTHTMMVYLYVAGAGSLVGGSKKLLYARYRQFADAGRLRVGRQR
ncbi:O-antigen ligase family protein [Mesorhizobium sp. M0816]|uniref:O-antigen ligase family protein n=1 Tax=Mesorhizobium sp. M0816 TaxID=2957006 RepID=UPI003335AD40